VRAAIIESRLRVGYQNMHESDSSIDDADRCPPG
jgi:hypothetical protein